MNDYLIDFGTFLREVKKCSDNTYHSYLHDLTRFSDYCKVHRLRDTANVHSNDIVKFMTALDSEGLSNSSKMHMLASLRCYFSFLNKAGIAGDNPALGIKTDSSVKKLPEVFTVKEINQLLSQPNGSDYKSCRDKAMLDLMYATGIKVSELISLNVGDVNLSVGILVIHSDQHERIIPIYPAALKSLSHYILKVRPSIILDPQEDRLFTNMSGQPLSRQGFWKIVKMYAKQAKIDKDITPLTFRHSFATHLLENGADLNDIKEMLGHSDISTTNVYARLVKNKYTLAYKKYHPLAK